MNIKKIINNQKGQSMVELAIILPILLLIIMGIFEFGRVMNAYLTINHAAREGARAASLGSYDTQIIEKIDTASYPLDILKLTKTISPSKISRTRGAYAAVTVAYDFDIIIPIIQNLVPSPLHIETQVVMRIE